MGIASSATWLISGTSGGVFRAGIQVLDSDGTLRIYSGAGFMQLSPAGALTNLASITSTSFVGALTGNASTATTLATGRTINGTSFNGSANITTSSWGTARVITIGATGKSVDGSAAVSWSAAEMGFYSKAETDAAAIMYAIALG